MPKLYWPPLLAELLPGLPFSKSDGSVYDPGGGEPIRIEYKLEIILTKNYK